MHVQIAHFPEHTYTEDFLMFSHSYLSISGGNYTTASQTQPRVFNWDLSATSWKSYQDKEHQDHGFETSFE